jgi:hypothetical protein
MAVIFDPLISNIAVEDYSVPATESTLNSLDTSLSAVFPVFCSKGRDNVITENKSSSTIMSNYGDDFSSFTKWGQANIAALGIVRSAGRAFICRLLPDDAMRSYVVFGIYTKPATDIPQYERNDIVYSPDRTSVLSYGTASYKLTRDGDKIPIMVKSSPGVEEPDTEVTLNGLEIRIGTKALEDSDFDENKYPNNYNHEIGSIGQETFYPLFAFSYYGRGKGGNSFGFNISRDTGRDKSLNDGRRYYMTCYEQLSSGSLSPVYSEPFYFSFNPDALFSPDSNIKEGLSAVYQNIDEAGNEVPLKIFVYDDNYLSLVNDLSQFKDNSETIYDIDFINCIFKNGNPYGRIVKSQNSIDITNNVLTLSHGHDGSLDPERDGNTSTSIETLKDDLRIKFWKYEIDEILLDEKICDIDLAPDCNYNPIVKKSMLRDFHTYRPDVKMVMDVGITRSYREAINFWTEYIPFINTKWAYMVTVNAHAGTLTDPSINRPYQITYTYDYIRSMADNFATPNGAFQMHAGSTRGRVKYFRPSWIAQKSLNNMFEALEEIGLNYIERIDKYNNLMYGFEATQYMIGSQSKLASDRNSLVIGRAIRICHGVLINFKYDERHIDESMAAAQRQMNNELARSNIPNTIGITTLVYQTKEDKREENAHCDIVFTFPNYLKKFRVTIYALRPESALPPAIAERLTA